MRVLVVTNLEPDAATPQRGQWVRDQVEEIRRRGIEVEYFSFALGRDQYVPATRRLRRLLRQESFDLVHAHYGIAGWCARLAGAKPLLVTFHGTDVRHRVVGAMSRRLARRAEVGSGVSRALYREEGGRPGLPRVPGASAVLPTGPSLQRFKRIPQAEARKELGLDTQDRLLLFPANPIRPEKRHDRAAELAEACDARLLTGGSIEPERMPLWVNAAGAVLVTSTNEGFGLACLEALACDRPILSTPVGIAPFALAGVPGCLCEPFDTAVWAEVARAHLDAEDPRVPGAQRVEAFSSGRMAERVIEVYREMAGSGYAADR